MNTIPNELEGDMYTIGKRHFLPYKDLYAVEIMIYLLTEKLRAYHAVCPEKARIAGELSIPREIAHLDR